MKELLTTNWNFMRVLRLVLGFTFLISAYMQMEMIPAVIGVLFMYQSVMNVGCAGGACAVEHRKPNNTIEDIEYTEVK